MTSPPDGCVRTLSCHPEPETPEEPPPGDADRDFWRLPPPPPPGWRGRGMRWACPAATAELNPPEEDAPDARELFFGCCLC